MADLIAALEKALGQIQEGWTVPLEGHDHMLQVVRYASPGLTAYSTLGLSQLPLRSPTGHRRFHLELLMCFREQPAGHWPAGALQNLASEMIDRDLAVLRGDCIGPRGPLRPGSRFEALYCTSPIFLDEADHSVVDEAGRDVALVWVLPVTSEEAGLRRDAGWEALEDRLEADFEALFSRA